MGRPDPQLYGLTLGLLLAGLREKSELRQADLAERLGVAQSSLSRYENGECLPDPLFLTNLAEVLPVSAAELLALVQEGLTRVERAARQVLTLPKQRWWPSAVRQAGERGAKGLVLFAVSAILLERR